MFLDCAFDPVCVRSASYSGMCGGRAAAWLSQKRAAKAGGRVVFERLPDVLRNLLNHRQNHLRNPCPAQGDVFTGDTSNKESRRLEEVFSYGADASWPQVALRKHA